MRVHEPECVSVCVYLQMEQVRSLEPVSVVVGSFVIVQSPKVWFAHFSFLATAAFLPVLGFITSMFASRRSCAHVQALEWFRSAHSRRPCSPRLWNQPRFRWPASSLSNRRRYGLPHSAFHHRNTPASAGYRHISMLHHGCMCMNRNRLFCVYLQMEQVRSLEPVSVVVGSFVIVQSSKVWLATVS